MICLIFTTFIPIFTFARGITIDKDSNVDVTLLITDQHLIQQPCTDDGVRFKRSFKPDNAMAILESSMMSPCKTETTEDENSNIEKLNHDEPKKKPIEQKDNVRQRRQDPMEYFESSLSSDVPNLCSDNSPGSEKYPCISTSVQSANNPSINEMTRSSRQDPLENTAPTPPYATSNNDFPLCMKIPNKGYEKTPCRQGDAVVNQLFSTQGKLVVNKRSLRRVKRFVAGPIPFLADDYEGPLPTYFSVSGTAHPPPHHASGCKDQASEEDIYQGVGTNHGIKPGVGTIQGIKPGFGSDQGIKQGFGTDQDITQGFGTIQGIKPGFGSDQGIKPIFETDQDFNPGFGTIQDTKPGSGTIQGITPGFGTNQNTKPGFGTFQNTKPGFGTIQGMKPGFGIIQEIKPGFGAHQELKPGFGIIQEIKPEFGTDQHFETGFGTDHQTIDVTGFNTNQGNTWFTSSRRDQSYPSTDSFSDQSTFQTHSFNSFRTIKTK